MLSKAFAIVVASLLTGCAHVGELEALNDLGKGGRNVGAAIRTATSSCVVLYGSQCTTTTNAAQINTTYGQIKQLPYHVRSGRPATAVAETLNVIR